MRTYIDDLGYETIWGMKDRLHSKIRVHVLVAESFFKGPLPEDNVVHHINEDRLNNDPSNLMVCHRQEHPRIHRKLKAKKECGNENWVKCCYCGEYDMPDALYQTYRPNGHIRGYHRQCATDYERERRLNKRIR